MQRLDSIFPWEWNLVPALKSQTASSDTLGLRA